MPVSYSSYEIWNFATRTKDPPQTRAFAKHTESRPKDAFESRLDVFFRSCDDSQAMPWTLADANTRWEARSLLLWGSIMLKDGACPDRIEEACLRGSAWISVAGIQD